MFRVFSSTLLPGVAKYEPAFEAVYSVIIRSQR